MTASGRPPAEVRDRQLAVAHSAPRLPPTHRALARLRAAREPLPGDQRRAGAGDGRRSLGAGDPLLRHGAALRTRSFRATSRRGSCRPSARQLRRLDQGRPAARAGHPAASARRRRLRGSGNPSARLGLQPRRGASLAREQPRATWARPRRRRLPPRSRRSLGRGLRRRLPGARGAASAGRRLGDRRRHEPDRDVGRVRPQHRHGSPDARRSLHAAGAARPRRVASCLPRAGRRRRRGRHLQQWAAFASRPG